MIRGLLLDLDNTLLSIDVDDFIERYSRIMARAFLPDDPERALAVITGASYALLTDREARDTNQHRLVASLARELDRSEADIWHIMETEAVGALDSLRTLAVPLPWTRDLVAEARRRDLRLAIATNPIYPRAVIEERIRWAGVDPSEVDAVASLETCRSTKPHLDYFAEMASALGLSLETCLMVGDDPDQDVPDAPSDLRVHLLAAEPDVVATGLVRHGPVDALWRIWADELAPILA